MADHPSEQDSFLESVTEKITDAFQGDSPSSGSDDDVDNNVTLSSVKNDVYRLFGRDKPVHKVFGGGQAANIFLWREPKVTAGVVGVATAVWVLFEMLHYHLITLVCHVLLVAVAVNFLCARASSFTNKSLPQIPELVLPEDLVLDVAAALRVEINRAYFVLREIAVGKDVKKFLSAIVGLWIISVLGGCFSFLTLLYIAFILLHTVPMFYEKYEDQVDAYAEKAEAEIKKQFALFAAKHLSKLPLGPLKGKLA